MKIAPHKNTDQSRFQRHSKELEVLYGLPRKVHFCKKCDISNQQPMSNNEYSHSSGSNKKTLEFSDTGLCHACYFNELKSNGEISWSDREAEFHMPFVQYRKNDGSYGCIVGSSGGKDSAMQSHLLKYKYKMTPPTVVWSHYLWKIENGYWQLSNLPNDFL